MIEVEDLDTPWSKVSARESDAWHSMCSYLGAFPPALANYFIRYFTHEGDIVMDPFSGRGTTSLEAKLLNRKSIATDLNPVALALTEAKNVSLSIEEIFNRIDELERKYDIALYQPEALAQADEVHLIFHPRTLAQLIYLKRKLLKSEKQVDKFLIGISLGILHGGERNDGTSAYASIDMPNTFSMSPDYVRRFVQTKQLNRFYRDVFGLLREKTQKMFKRHVHFAAEGIVYKADVKNLSSIELLKDYRNRTNLILTSPPYLGIVNYAKQNWIRLWFMNQDPKSVHEELDDNLNLHEWISFAKASVVQLKTFLKDDGVAVFVIGDVAKSKTSMISLAREFCLMIKENKLFDNVWCINDSVANFNKTTRIWGETRGEATAIDRIVILSNINPFQTRVLPSGIEPLNIEMLDQSTKFFLGK